MTAKTKPLTVRDRGLALGLALHRHKRPRDWRAGLEAEDDPEVRAVAEEYLSGIAERIRTLRGLAAAKGFTGTDAVERWRAHERHLREAREALRTPPATPALDRGRP